MNLVYDAVVLPRPDVGAVELLLGFELLVPVWARVHRQFLYVRNHLAADKLVQSGKIPARGWTKFNPVRQAGLLVLPRAASPSGFG